jgi:catechol 2,3-dioxygenase-like lactoylglutathione lyase family enzyme
VPRQAAIGEVPHGNPWPVASCPLRAFPRRRALSNGVSLDFHDTDDEIAAQHYAFLLGEDDFERVFGRIRERRLEHWADPGQHRAGEINRNDGGRGVYFEDPDGHLLEVITRPYGSGG